MLAYFTKLKSTFYCLNINNSEECNQTPKKKNRRFSNPCSKAPFELLTSTTSTRTKPRASPKFKYKKSKKNNKSMKIHSESCLVLLNLMTAIKFTPRREDFISKSKDFSLVLPQYYFSLK